MTKEEALKTYYGYDAFRGGQEAVIDALLSGRDALAIMPTGAGKSICYQIPALLLPGITLVVSPLVSLMRDQVTQLVQMGIPAAFLNSSLTFRQYLLALDRAREGRYKIIYVAPERLETEGFQSFVREADISLVVVLPTEPVTATTGMRTLCLLYQAPRLCRPCTVSSTYMTDMTAPGLCSARHSSSSAMSSSLEPCLEVRAQAAPLSAATARKR